MQTNRPALLLHSALCPKKDGRPAAFQAAGKKAASSAAAQVLFFLFFFSLLYQRPKLTAGFEGRSFLSSRRAATDETYKVFRPHFSTRGGRVQTLPFDAINYPLYSSIPAP